MKIIIKLALSISFLIGFNKPLNAQTNEVYKAIYNAMNFNHNLYESDNYKNRSFVFSVSISINKKGRVYDVVYSEKSKLFLGLLIDFERMSINLKNNTKDFVTHKNETLVQLFVFNRGDDKIIRNGDELIEAWSGIAKIAKKIQDKKTRQLFLVPIIIQKGAIPIIN